jgi:alkaline phosphatase
MSDKNVISRLNFIKTGLLSTAGIGLGLNGLSPDSKAKKSYKNGSAKNVIFLVSDGMSSGTLAMTDVFKRLHQNEQSNWMKLYTSDKRPFSRGLMDMASLNSVVTDSAAASSSWGCGQRVYNGKVNWGENGEKLKPICKIFKDAGKSAGLVSTARITHATPAGFSTNVEKRGMEEEIARQQLEGEFDVLLGGGDRYFSGEFRKDKTDLYKKFKANGYDVAKTKADMEGSNSDKLIGIFSKHHMPYTIDQNNDSKLTKEVPTLSEMTRTALDKLSSNSEGFILQVEGGRVDHAAHGNDAAGIIYDQLAFDDAIEEVLNFTKDRDDTLVILTSDHGNANPGLNGLGDYYGDSNEMLLTIADYRHSFEWIQEKLNEYTNPTANRIQEIVETATQTKITKKQAKMLEDARAGKLETPFENRSRFDAVLSGVLANYNGIYFVGTNHTADYTELACWGPGHERLSPLTKNTDLFNLMVEMAGVEKFVG